MRVDSAIGVSLSWGPVSLYDNQIKPFRKGGRERVSDVDWEEANLEGVVWHQKTFDQANFRHVRWEGAEIRGCRFLHCDFTGASFNHAILKDSFFAACEWRWARFIGAQLIDLKMVGNSLEQADLAGIVIRGGDWSSTRMRYQVLSGQDFSGMQWREADFYGADLRQVQFHSADLTRVVLDKANLTDADLRGAEIEGINWVPVALHQVILDQAQAIQVVRSLGATVRD